jgi:tRNA pseudouridine38-40 synthase
MTVWALLLEYHGGPFVGWQRQATGLSVQAVLETAAARLSRQTPTPTVVAGRTDAGVHAEAQVVQLTLETAFDPARLREALNFYMKPHPVVVLRAAVAPDGWSARFSAIGRSYCYRILNRRARPALLLGRVWHIPRPLDAAAMHRAGQLLIGRHDFTSFRAASCQARSPVRTLDQLDVALDGELITVTVRARSFLHHQVRNIVGTLRMVGDGTWPERRVGAALAARDRAAAGPTAPAAGLTLLAVTYPRDLFEAPAGDDAPSPSELRH